MLLGEREKIMDPGWIKPNLNGRRKSWPACFDKHILFFFAFAALRSLTLNNTKLGSGSFEGKSPSQLLKRQKDPISESWEQSMVGQATPASGGHNALCSEASPEQRAEPSSKWWGPREVGRRLVRGHDREGWNTCYPIYASHHHPRTSGFNFILSSGT